MEQQVRVTQTHDDGTATVLYLRESACSGDCHKCAGCGACKDACPTEAIIEGSPYTIDAEKCVDCGACAAQCPCEAISAE